MPNVIAENEAHAVETLRPYAFHGVDLTYKPGEKNAVGDCPFCGREGKFSVLLATGVSRCLVCGVGSAKGGLNPQSFIREIHAASKPDAKFLKEIAKDRGILNVDTLVRWGLRRSTTTRDLLLPGYTPGKDGIRQVYRYIQTEKGKKLLPTPTLGHALHFSDRYDGANKTVYICEGPWDAMALEEVFATCKMTDSGLKKTGSAGILGDASVVAVPGCNTFLESWLTSFGGKRVVLMFDSDHPRENGGKTHVAGYDGMRRVAGLLSSCSNPPAEISYIKWGPNGFDPALKSGYDVRDALIEGTTIDERMVLANSLLTKIEPVPDDWKKSTAVVRRGESLELADCHDWKSLVTSWRKAMKWTDGLDHALAVMLASIVSVKSIGDQIWFKVIGPPSCGKSTLCEALSVASEYVMAKSTMRGFHSGYSDGDDSADHSLIASISGKTLITKDGDTLLQSPNLSQILSEARDIYDTVSRTSYRNKMSRDYSGIRMTWILCGTSTLRVLDDSELGARFLDCVIMEGIDDDLEDEVLIRVAHKARRTTRIEADGKPETHQEPEMTAVMKMTGGYVCWLRENAQKLLNAADMDDATALQIARFGKFVAYFRARPSKRQNENAEREFGSRLVGQHIRLALCLSVVLNRPTVDEEVMRRVRRIALDTARGHSLNIARHLYNAGEEGCEVKNLALWTHKTENDTRTMLRYLRDIGVVELFTPPVQKEDGKRLANRPRYRLTPRLNKLYEEVAVDA